MVDPRSSQPTVWDGGKRRYAEYTFLFQTLPDGDAGFVSCGMGAIFVQTRAFAWGCGGDCRSILVMGREVLLK